MLKLYPVIFHRISSSSFSELDALHPKELLYLIEQTSITYEKLAQSKSKLTDVLFKKINQCSDAKVRNKLLNGKRAIHNLRPLKSKEIKLIGSYLNEEEIPLFDNYQEEYTRRHLLYEQSAAQYTAGMERIRNNFRNMIRRNVEFQKSLQISSQSLFDQLFPYLNVHSATLKKTQVQTEYSLIKYITRQYAKTSPFSRFTYLAVSGQTGDHNKSKVHVRLNNYIFSYLKGLLFQVPDILKQIPLALNPTFKATDSHYDFLINFNNVEVFQNVSHSNVTDLTIELIETPKSIDEIIRLLLLKYPETSPEELEKYLMKLIEIGLLTPHIGISGTDPLWAGKFIVFLEKLSKKNSNVILLKECLQKLLVAAKKLEEADIPSRNEVLQASYLQLKESIRKFCQKHHLPFTEGLDRQKAKKEFLERIDENSTFVIRYFNGFYFTVENIFYEDAHTTVPQNFTDNDLKTLVERLNTVYTTLLSANSYLQEKYKLLSFFDHHYEKTNEVPLIDFYRQFYSQHRKNEKKVKRQKVSSGVLNSEFSQILKDQENLGNRIKKVSKQKLFTLLGTREFTHPTGLNFSESEISNIFGIDTNLNKPYSKAAHLQLYKPHHKDTYHAVVNGIFNGYGRGYGRFLHLFPDKITEKTREINEQLFEGFFAAEIKDASCFNANIHPPLMPYEIVIPGGNADLPLPHQIALTDIVVKKAGEDLKLIHQPTGKEILPFDLCLQTNSTRSELYQLLTLFSPSKPISVYTLQNWVYEFIEQNHSPDEVVRFPRISIDEVLVLSRECWKIPLTCLPEDEPAVSDFDYFIKVEHWRTYYQIPRHSFLFINPSNRSESNASTQDDYKPQYIDFQSPLLVRLFRKACRKAGKYLRIEEMLPAPEHMESDKVSESLIQWYDE